MPPLPRPSPAMNNLWSDVVWFVIPHFLHKAEESRGVLGHSVVRPAQEVEVPHRKGFVIPAPSPHLTVLQKHKCKLIQLSDQMVLTYFNMAHTPSTGGVSYSLGQTWTYVQWNLSIKASWAPMVSSIERFHCIPYCQLGPNGILYREVPLYTGQPAGSQWCPL